MGLKRKPTKTAITSLIENVINQLKFGKLVTGIILDFSKAFDSIRHDLILSKLKSLGIKGISKAWFQYYLRGHGQVVEIKCTHNNTIQHVRSAPKEITRRMPQGSVLGTILFILFTNHLPKHLCNICRCLMYADDTTLVVSKNTADSIK